MEQTVTYEAKLISILMVFPKTARKVYDHVQPDDFASDLYKAAYQYTVDQLADNKLPEMVDMVNILGIKSYDINTVSALAVSEYDAVPTAQVVHDNGKKRRLNEYLASISAESLSILGRCSDDMLDDILETAYTMRRGETRGKSQELASAAADMYSWLIDEKPDKYMTTGYEKLDRIVGGIRPGNLVILAARPAVGKSAFASNLIFSLSKRGVKSEFFSCEMSTHEIMVRLLASESGVQLEAIAGKKIDTRNTNHAVMKTARTIGSVPMSIYDQPGITTADIRRELQTKRDIQIIAVDYIQIMRGIGKYENRNLEVGKITGELKQIAKEFDVPVIALSQLNRSRDETDEPGLIHLRDSGSVEQDADKVILMWLTETAQPGQPKRIGVKVAKNRMGKTGTVIMEFDGDKMRFTETSDEYQRPTRRKTKRFDDDLSEEW